MRENFFGTNYPSEYHDILVEMFSIKEGELVLDVGGGHKPFSRADFILEKDLFKGSQRDGKPVPMRGFKIIAGDIVCLPFKDKSFDFVFCSHVLEHVSDVALACAELMRVAKRGYIETPRKWTEFYAGHPSHRWLVDLIDGRLYFERRMFIDSPFMNFMLPQVWMNPDLFERAHTAFRNITCVQLLWEGSFDFVIYDEKNDDVFNYDDPVQAAFSHYSFAKNVLKFRAPPEYGIYHAQRAVELQPDDERYRTLLEEYKKSINCSRKL